MRAEKHQSQKHEKVHTPYPWFILALAFFTILLTSKNSPIHIFNDWTDTNAFMTMGKGWINGLIPYRDLFEQKGPILYLIYALANLISKTYFGIYLIESLLFFAALYLVFAISNRYLEFRASFFVCCVMSWLLTLYPYFRGGGAAEELVYILIFFSIYLLLKLDDQHFLLTNRQSFLAGLAVGLLFWTKYTMIGSYLGAFIILIGAMVYRRQIFALVTTLLFSLLGFLTITLPILLYFAANQALDDLKFNYFTSNLQLYPSNPGASSLWKILNAIHLFFEQISGDFTLLFLLVFLLIYLLISKSILKTDLAKFTYCGMYMALILSTFYGGKTYLYYFLILFPFALLPVIALVRLLPTKNISPTVFSLLCLVTLFLTVGSNDNLLSSKLYPDNRTYTYLGKYEEPFQLAFAKIINQSKKPTLLNYGSLDIGLYHAADVLPINYYFEKQNIPDEELPEMMAEQNELVSNKKVEFVVVRTTLNADEKKSVPENIHQNYKLVATQNQSHMDTTDFTYRLYQVKK